MRTQLFVGISIIVISLMAGMCISCTEVAERSIRERELLAQRDVIHAEEGLTTVETDGYIRRLEKELDVYKSKARFDSDMAVQMYSDHFLELSALQASLMGTQEALDILNHNNRAAADNSLWALILFPICIAISTAASAAFAFALVRDFQKNLRKSVREAIEEMLKEQEG